MAREYFGNCVTAADTPYFPESRNLSAVAFACKPTLINGKILDAVSSNVDDRTIHELYIWPFADAVHAGVASVMCSYNRVNETYSCESEHLINNLLKKELGFEGYVMSDFLATPPGLGPVKAGLDMNQPGPVNPLPLVETYWGDNLVEYPDQDSRNSILDVLTGNINPSGKLPYTIAKKEEDYNGKFTNITGSAAEDSQNRNVTLALYEFGYGLSYTTFGLSPNLVVSSANEISARASLSHATLALGGNPHFWETVGKCHAEPSTDATWVREGPSGARGGQGSVIRPRRWDLSYWDVALQDWMVPKGGIKLSVGFSSKDLRSSTTVQLVN
ncbi:glycoside hydrolase superfamily [Fusarium coicis]|nr:glycoside hydrolase superfamily [Fusarium coicis]